MLGKRLYKTSMLNLFRIVVLAITIFFLNDLYLETFTYEKFQSIGRFKILDVLNHHLMYPNAAIMFFTLIILPAIYYCFIRGAGFYEKGFIFNRGIPFMNTTVLYEEVKYYKLLHPKVAIAIHTYNEDVFVIADNNAERVIAILDQHNIQGDLAQDDYVKLITSYKKFVVMLVSFTIAFFVFKRLGLLTYLM